MTPTETAVALPPWLDDALVRTLCGRPSWSAPLDVAVARRALASSMARGGDLMPLFHCLARVAPHGLAASCVRDVAVRMRAGGLEPVIPDVVLRHAVQPSNLPAPAPRALCGTRVEDDRNGVITVVAGAVALAMGALALVVML